MKRFLLVATIATLQFTFLGCSTSPKTYQPPSTVKMRAAAVKLNSKVTQARETAAKAKKAGIEAKGIHEKIVFDSLAIRKTLAKWGLELPEQYKGPFQEVSDSVDALIVENTALQTKLDELLQWNTQLELRLNEAEVARLALQKEQDDYAGAATVLAGEATIERNFRIKAEQQLTKQKIFGLFWKLGGGIVIAGIIALIALWFTGKLAFKFMK